MIMPEQNYLTYPTELFKKKKDKLRSVDDIHVVDYSLMVML